MSDATQIIRAIEKLVAGDRSRLTVSKDTQSGNLVFELANASGYVGEYPAKRFVVTAEIPVKPEVFTEALLNLVAMSGDD